MTQMENLLSQPSRKVAVILALVGTITPLAGLHKFYLRQPVWGVIYLLLWSTPMPRIACAIEAVWYLMEDQRRVPLAFGHWASDQETNLHQVGALAEAMRQLDQLRADGLVSEYEFEQKRRQLLDRIA